MIKSIELKFFAQNFKNSPNRGIKCRLKFTYGLKQWMDFTALNFSKLEGTQFVSVRSVFSEFCSYCTKCVENMVKIVFVFGATHSVTGIMYSPATQHVTNTGQNVSKIRLKINLHP